METLLNCVCTGAICCIVTQRPAAHQISHSDLPRNTVGQHPPPKGSENQTMVLGLCPPHLEQ